MSGCTAKPTPKGEIPLEHGYFPGREARLPEASASTERGRVGLFGDQRKVRALKRAASLPRGCPSGASRINRKGRIRFLRKTQKPRSLSQRLDTVSHSDRYLRYRVPDLICEGFRCVGIESSSRKGALRSEDQKQVGKAVGSPPKVPLICRIL